MSCLSHPVYGIFVIAAQSKILSKWVRRQRTLSKWFNRNDLTVYKGVRRVNRPNNKRRSQMLVIVRSCQHFQGRRDKSRRWLHQSLGAGTTHGRAAPGKLVPWRRRDRSQKYWWKQGEEERHSLASHQLPHSRFLSMTLAGQTNQKPIGKGAWAMCLADINPL